MEDYILKDDVEVALALAQMGHPVRLKILRMTIKSGMSGVSVGQLKDDLNIPGSTLTHHLKSLIKVDLISQQRDKQKLYCVANLKKMNSIFKYINEDCCRI